MGNLKLLQANKGTLRRHRVKLFQQQRLERNYMSLSVFLSSVRVYHNLLIVERAIWSKERSSDWWDRIVVEFGDEEWRENFQMSRTLFNFLCSELKERIEKQDTRLRCAIGVHRRVAIALWRLATNADY